MRKEIVEGINRQVYANGNNAPVCKHRVIVGGVVYDARTGLEVRDGQNDDMVFKKYLMQFDARKAGSSLPVNLSLTKKVVDDNRISQNSLYHSSRTLGEAIDSMKTQRNLVISTNGNLIVDGVPQGRSINVTSEEEHEYLMGVDYFNIETQAYIVSHISQLEQLNECPRRYDYSQFLLDAMWSEMETDADDGGLYVKVDVDEILIKYLHRWERERACKLENPVPIKSVSMKIYLYSRGIKKVKFTSDLSYGPHPHVRGNSLCMGSIKQRMDSLKELAEVINAMPKLLEHVNCESVYAPLHEIYPELRTCMERFVRDNECCGEFVYGGGW